MNYYAAPMEGLTDRVWRQAHQKLSLIHISEPTDTERSRMPSSA